MIIDKVDEKDMQEMEVPEIHLSRLGIGEEHYEAIEKVARELDKQGIPVKLIR
jgi:sulfate adenylyltransferase subunit 1